MSGTGETIFVVDDDADIRHALTRLLSTDYSVRSFASSESFLADRDPEAPGCILLDIAMNGLDGLRTQQALTSMGDPRPVVFLTGHGDIRMTVDAMKAGAVDFLTKPVDATELFAAIRQALTRDAALRAACARRASIEGRFRTLTSRERQVLRHVLSGELNKQIAARLGTCEKTIKVHRARAMAKMGTRSVATLARVAALIGIDAPEFP